MPSSPARPSARARALLLSVASLAALACGPSPHRAESAREEIRGAIERGDRADAVAAVEVLRDALPHTPEALLEVAAALVTVGSAPDAAWRLEEGLRRFPGRDDLRVAMAHVALLLSNPSRAREVLLAVEEGSAHHPEALLLLGEAELKLGDLDAALAVFEQAEQAYPDRPEAALARVGTLLRERRHDEARAAIEALRADLALSDPADERAARLRHRLALTLAQLRARQGEPEAAIAELEAVLERDPRDIQVWQGLVSALLQQRRRGEALERVERVLAGDEPLAELLPVAAQLYTAQGRRDEADRALRRYAEQADAGSAWVPLVLLHSNADDVAGASAAVEEALARFPDDAALHLLDAETRLAANDLEGAWAASARFAEASFEGDPQVEYLEARLALAEGRAEEAAARLRELAPRLDSAATHFWLGRALAELGDGEGAIRRYAQAQRRDPSWAAPAAELIAIAGTRRDWDAMAAHARTLVRRAPQRIESWSLLVDALVAGGRPDEALRTARRAAGIFSDPEPTGRMLARALRAQGRSDEALAALDAAGPGGGWIELERIHTLAGAGRLDEALALAREQTAAHPERADRHAALAGVAYGLGAAEEGDRASERALALAPHDASPLRVRCEFRAASGRWQGAREDCTRYLAARPEDAGAHFVLGLARASLGDVDGAIASYRRAAELDLSDPRPRNNVAELLARRGELDAALAQAQEAYRLAGDDANVIDTLGALYLRKGLPERAVALLERAHQSAPELPHVSLNLALAYRDAGRTDDARALLTRLAQQDESRPLRARVEEALHSLE